MRPAFPFMRPSSWLSLLAATLCLSAAAQDLKIEGTGAGLGTMTIMADSINRVGHIMGLQTVGEYSESEAAIDELRQLGVDVAHGYGVQRPQPLPGPGRVPPMAAAAASSAGT